MRKALLIVLVITIVAGFWLTEKVFYPFLNITEDNIYPTNDVGLSYGPDIKENVDPNIEPELIMVCNEDGISGYIYATDIKEGATSLEEAIHWEPRSYTIPMYLKDGETVIGEFKITGDIAILN